MIHLDTDVTVTLPFHCYALRISHRLLTGLGGVSRFMLEALDDGLTLDMIASATALPHALLDEQLAFLSQHGFVTAEVVASAAVALTERGRRMVRIDRLLQDDVQRVWLDAFTRKRSVAVMLVGVDEGTLIADPSAVDAATGVVAAMPARPRHYPWFDEVGRVRALLDEEGLIDLLTALWPGYASLVHEELDHWEYSLHRQGTAVGHFPLKLPAGTWPLLPSQGPAGAWPRIALPAVRLVTRFSAAAQWPWPLEVPPDEQRLIELVSMGDVTAYPGVQAAVDLAQAEELMQLPPADERRAPALDPRTLAQGIAVAVESRRLHLACDLPEGVLVDRLASACAGRVISTRQRRVAEAAA